MTTFTLLLGRLVEHLGAEAAAKLVREFAGQVVQFPITQDYTGRNDTSTTPEFKRKVTSRMSIFVCGIEYDVSHLPSAAVGEVITVDPMSLTRLRLDRFAFAAELLQASSRADEMNPAATDLQDPLSAHALLAAFHRVRACLLHKCAHSPEAAECPIFCRTQVLQPAHETQSDMRPIDPVSVAHS